MVVAIELVASTSAHVSIRQHTSAFVSICQHTYRADSHASMILGIISTSLLFMEKHTFSNAGVWW